MELSKAFLPLWKKENLIFFLESVLILFQKFTQGDCRSRGPPLSAKLEYSIGAKLNPILVFQLPFQFCQVLVLNCK